MFVAVFFVVVVVVLAPAFSPPYPPSFASLIVPYLVQVTIAMGKFDVTQKIADEGGGASRSEVEKLWTYYYTTANKFLVGSPPSPVRLDVLEAKKTKTAICILV